MKAREDFLFLDRLRLHFGDSIDQVSDDLLQRLRALWSDGELHGAGVMCDRCGSTENVKTVGSMTAYCETEENPDPNHPTPYCPECTQEYEDHWNEMWDEYNSGRL